MKTLLGWLWFVVIQIVALALAIVGVPLIAVLAATDAWKFRYSRYDRNVIEVWRGGWLTWLWGNEEDGLFGPKPSGYVGVWGTNWRAFVWSALRNPVNNLRFLVLWIGGPWFQVRRGGWYFQAGFRPDTGWPVLSAGRGTGTVIR